MTDFTTLCDQRRRRMALNIPPARFTVISPYEGTSLKQFDLDMRRKAEILKYSSNKMSTQTNSLTKKQRWAQIARGNFTQPSVTAVDPSSNDLVGAVCPNDDMIPMSTRKSGVPGPEIFLYLDKTVPLYNYATANRTYPFNIQTDFQYWRIATKEDVLLPHNNEREFFTMSINSNIDQPFYVYTITFPVGLLVTGTILQNNIPKTQPVTLSIFSITATIYYSNNVVRTINVPVTLQSLVFNVAGKTGSFSAVQYVGNIVMSNIRLVTEPGYIYDMKLMFRINIIGGGSNYFSNIQAFAYANLSLLNNIIQNCNVTSLPATTKNEGFKIVGA